MYSSIFRTPTRIVIAAILLTLGLVVTSIHYSTHEILSPSVTSSPHIHQHLVETDDDSAVCSSTSSSISSNSDFWSPTVCMPGTLLVSSKFQQNCKKSNVVPADVYCSGEVTSPVCGQYSGGKFLRQFKAASTEAKENKHTRCSSKQHLEDKINSKNWFFEQKRNLLQSRVCDFEYLAPDEIFTVLQESVRSRSSSAKKNVLRPVILFSGDSMMRQLFLRLISLLRGQLDEPLSEHYFHFDAAYVVIDGQYDALVPLGISGKLAASAVPEQIRKQAADELVKLGLLPKSSEIVQALLIESNKRERGNHIEADDSKGATSSSSIPTLTMVFQWETKPSKSRNEFLTLRPAIHVAAWMYWWQKKDPLSDFDVYSKAVDAYHQEFVPSDQHQCPLYIYVTTPWTREGIFGGVDEPIRKARNRKAVEWLMTTRSTSEKLGAGVQRRLVDFSAIADLKKFSKTKDEIHYMCIWQPKLPGTVNEQKFVADNKCVDMMNAAVAQMLVHTMT